MSLTLADDRIVPAGGYRLRGGLFFDLSGERANVEGSFSKPIFETLEDHLKKNPTDLDKLRRGLI